MNENYKLAMASLMNEDTLAAIQSLEKLEDPEEQGYQSAHLILAATGLTDPNELLLRMQLAPRREAPSLSDAKRDIGVLRWCLDNRAK